MKATLLVAALAFTTSVALAQTTPTTTSGAQTGTSTTAAGAGTNTTTAVDPTSNGTPTTRMDNMSGSDKKAMRKSKKMKSSDGTMKTKTKM